MKTFKTNDRFTVIRRGNNPRQPVVYTVFSQTDLRVYGRHPDTGSVHIFWKDTVRGPWPAAV